jgi:hypothetical protein
MTQKCSGRALAFAALAALAAGLVGCAEPRTAPRAAEARSGQFPDAKRARDTVDPRTTITNPAPSRTVQIPSIGPDPTAVGPQGALPNPYSNPR